MNLRIGTSGFSYDDWMQVFYPEGIAKKDMLSYYARKFSTVEINVSYYTIPGAASFEKMTSKVPENFDFIVKVHQESTHIRQNSKASLQNLVNSVKPLIERNQLGGMLAQFPYSFYNNMANRQYLIETRDCLKEIPLFVEFRNDSWEKDAVKDFLSVNNIGYVNVDEPDLKGLIGQQDWLTTNIGYIRFHGRNKEKWWDGKGSERYEYNYSNDELQSWLIRISDILKKSYKSYVFFNNHPKGNAPNNAGILSEMIRNYIET
ncbi:MAG: DUF72 domain-containing protein [Calditrichaeota bacterium]|nr:DUF72 domain-containing protein [Calditrichota bacterium]